MIYSENRYPLFGIMLYRPAGATAFALHAGAVERTAMLPDALASSRNALT